MASQASGGSSSGVGAGCSSAAAVPKPASHTCIEADDAHEDDELDELDEDELCKLGQLPQRWVRLVGPQVAPDLLKHLENAPIILGK